MRGVFFEERAEASEVAVAKRDSRGNVNGTTPTRRSSREARTASQYTSSRGRSHLVFISAVPPPYTASHVSGFYEGSATTGAADLASLRNRDPFRHFDPFLGGEDTGWKLGGARGAVRCRGAGSDG